MKTRQSLFILCGKSGQAKIIICESQNEFCEINTSIFQYTNRTQMVKVLTYDIPDHKIKLKIRQFQVMGKKIKGKLITQAMNGTSVANRCNHQVHRIE